VCGLPPVESLPVLLVHSSGPGEQQRYYIIVPLWRYLLKAHDVNSSPPYNPRGKDAKGGDNIYKEQQLTPYRYLNTIKTKLFADALSRSCLPSVPSLDACGTNESEHQSKQQRESKQHGNHDPNQLLPSEGSNVTTVAGTTTASAKGCLRHKIHKAESACKRCAGSKHLIMEH
jgi:hypothetical protein